MRSIIVHAQKLSTDGMILGGDLNATVRNRVYSVIRDLGFLDAWSVGNRLVGGTWPGSHYPLPSWLIRIDYIFHSDTLVAKTAETLPHGFGSDHRGVFATFDLLPTPNSEGSDRTS